MTSPAAYAHTIRRIDRFFIGAGVGEMVLITFLSQHLAGLIPGLLTVWFAVMALLRPQRGWNYGTALMALLKYNPIVGLPVLFFVLGELPWRFGLTLFETVLMVFSGTLAVAIVLLSATFGIVLLMQLSRQKRAEHISEELNESAYH